jgi:hypothetical protein
VIRSEFFHHRLFELSGFVASLGAALEECRAYAGAPYPLNIWTVLWLLHFVTCVAPLQAQCSCNCRLLQWHFFNFSLLTLASSMGWRLVDSFHNNAQLISWDRLGLMLKSSDIYPRVKRPVAQIAKQTIK